jgi:hypothetical protein
MREIHKSGSMSGERKRDDASMAPSHRAPLRLYSSALRETQHLRAEVLGLASSTEPTTLHTACSLASNGLMEPLFLALFSAC